MNVNVIPFAKLAIAFCAGWGACALHSATESFFTMERNTRARRESIMAVTEYVNTTGDWPSSWGDLSEHFSSPVRKDWAKALIDVDFGGSLSDMGHQSPEAHVRSKGITLPEDNIDYEIDALRRSVISALGLSTL